MPRFKQFLALTALSLLMNPAQAALWDYVVTSEFGSVYFIDPLSIKRHGKVVSYTQLTNYSKNKEVSKTKLQSTVQYKTNDCAGARFYFSGLIGYEKENAKGSIMLVEMEKEPIWFDVTPKKIADVIHQEVCNYKY